MHFYPAPGFLSLSKSSFLILAKDECNPAEPFVACSVFLYFLSSFALTRPIPVLHARFPPTIIKRMLHAALHAVWQSSEEQTRTFRISGKSAEKCFKYCGSVYNSTCFSWHEYFDAFVHKLKGTEVARCVSFCLCLIVIGFALIILILLPIKLLLASVGYHYDD